MAEEKNERAATFARLYDLQEELRQREKTRLGRPPKRIKRKPTTVHLTAEEAQTLGELHLSVKRHFSVNRSELVGLAIEVLAGLVHEDGSTLLDETVTDLWTLKRRLYDFIKS
ncbi:MAG: hypothetical protein OEW09_05320 [Anaerolineae bacterium]|nr:hypothetical protein [Anaerolineae bacterium]